MLKTIKIKRITEEIVSQIREYIAKGELKAGDRLPSERNMAHQLGVSRSTVREALQALEHTGFVESQQGRGTYIKEIGRQSLTDPLQILIHGSDRGHRQMYEFRIVIETWAAGLAAVRATAEDIDRLGGIVGRMKRRCDQGRPLDDLDAAFHLDIARACHNDIYYHVANTILDLLSQVTRISHEQLFLSPADQSILMTDHEAIFKAIQSGNKELAKTLMQRHLNRVTVKTARDPGTAD